MIKILFLLSTAGSENHTGECFSVVWISMDTVGSEVWFRVNHVWPMHKRRSTIVELTIKWTEQKSV